MDFDQRSIRRNEVELMPRPEVRGFCFRAHWQVRAVAMVEQDRLDREDVLPADQDIDIAELPQASIAVNGRRESGPFERHYGNRVLPE